MNKHVSKQAYQKSLVYAATFLGVAAFLGVAFFFGAALDTAFFGGDLAVVLVTRPDLVLLRTVGFSTIALACNVLDEVM